MSKGKHEAELVITRHADGSEHTHLFSVYLEADALDVIAWDDARMKRIGFTFDEISEPTFYCSDAKYHVWRKLRWQVVSGVHKGQPTTKFSVVNQRALEDWEVEYWQGVKANATRRVVEIASMEQAA